jgi:hypothetical protein
MTTRIVDPPLENTKALLSIVVASTRDGKRCQFLTPPGEGERVVQRLRVMLSRARKKLIQRGEKFTHFKIHHDVFKYTNREGKRYDAVVIWQSRNHRHVMMELLEDIGV